MNCMKCGRESSNDQAFCPKCLEQMASHPVRPDVVVQLPLRQEIPLKKVPSRKKLPTPEEQIQRLKRKNRRLTAALCLILAASLFLFSITVDYFRQLDVQKILGQNYTTEESTG